MLHFSLARFAFDWEENKRTKVQSVISYPLKLDMAPFTTDKSKSEEWYQLKGVLMHKGKSAQHGHYVAQVHDIENDKWFLFDDEHVSPIDDLNAPSTYDEDDEPIGRKKDKSRAFPRDVDGNVRPKSKDPYMLIYTRVEANDGDRSASQLGLATGPPPLALAQVEAIDQDHAEKVKAWEVKANEVKDQFVTEREKKRSVYTQLNLAEDEKSGYLVSQASLSSWINQGLDKKTKLKTQLGEIDLTGDSNDQPGSDKVDQPMAAKGPAQSSDKPASSSTRARSTSPTLVETSDSASDDKSSSATGSQSSAPVLDCGVLSCEHGKVDVEEVASMKLISRVRKAWHSTASLAHR